MTPGPKPPSTLHRRDGGAASRGSSPRVAYVMSRFPKLTETFVLYEMKALEGLGAAVEVFPLLRHRAGPRHPEAVPYERRAHFVPLLSWEVVGANVARLTREPGRYLTTWWEALSGTWGSAKFFLGALGFFPKCVAFAARMEATGVDHIHAHFASHPALAALVVHRLTGIPYSFVAHGSDLHVERRMLARKVSAAAFVVAVSAYNRDLILEECGRRGAAKVVVIHCGTDPTVFGERAEPEAAPPERERGKRSLRIACVASLEEVKGHRFLLRACRLLADRGVDVSCDLAGGGPLRRGLERRVAELGLGDRVRFHGPLPRPEVGGLLATADVAVLASHPTRSGKREGIPVALMEAMMSGLPVVASRVSGIPELVEDERTGFLVPPGDPRLLADRLERLAEAPELARRLGAAGHQKVRADFDLHTGARLLLREIERCRSLGYGATGEASRRAHEVGVPRPSRRAS